MIFDKKEFKILWPFYADSFLGTIFYLLNPFLMVYLINTGISFTKIGLLLAIWPISSMLFEIPTGTFADKYGRKKSVILGWILSGLFLLMVPFSNNLYYLIILFALEGASMSLVSGAADAWVVDLLKYKNMGEYSSKYFTKRQSLINLALVLSGLIGVFVVKSLGIESVWFFSGGTLILTSLFLMFGEEKYITRSKKESKTFLEGGYIHITSSFKEITGNRKVFLLIFASFFMTIGLALNHSTSWTPLLKMQGLAEYQFGYLWSLGSLIGVIAPFISQKMAKKNKEIRTLTIFTLLFITIGILSIFSNTLLMSFILATAAITVMDFKRPVQLNYFHNQISSKKRATIGSIDSLLGGLGAAGSIFFMGLLIDTFGNRSPMIVSSLFGIIVLIIYSKIKNTFK